MRYPSINFYYTPLQKKHLFVQINLYDIFLFLSRVCRMLKQTSEIQGIMSEGNGGSRNMNNAFSAVRPQLQILSHAYNFSPTLTKMCAILMTQG